MRARRNTFDPTGRIVSFSIDVLPTHVN